MERTWIINPSPLGAEATLKDCCRRLGSPYVFESAYEAIVEKPLPAGADHTCPDAMDTLHAAVIRRPTIEASTTEILGAIAGFESGVHYHGADAHFLQSLGYAKPMVDLGKIIHRFLLPVRRRMQGLGKDCTLSKSVACNLPRICSRSASRTAAFASRPRVPPPRAHASAQVCVGCSDGCGRIDKPGRPETSVAL